MNRLSKKTVHKIGIFIGIAIFIIGFIFNSIFPSEFSRKNELIDFKLPKDEYHVNIIDPGIDNFDYDFKLELFIFISQESNCTVFILNSDEYEKFLIEGSIDNITTLKEFDGKNEPTFLSQNIGEIYILIVSFENNTEIRYFGYYYTITTPMFFFGAILMLIGTIGIFGVLALYLIGWKKYLVIGVGINVSMFIFRIIIMPHLLSQTSIMTHLHDFLNIELYRDFEAYYLGWSKLFTNGVFPYSEEYYGYAYGPLFILTIGSFAFLPIPTWSVAIPLLLSTITSGYLILLISNRLTNNEKYSSYAMIIYYLNPFTLLYSSFAWLNSSLFTFFVVLSFYLVLVKKNYLSILVLGIATMYKQFAIIFFPIILILVIKNDKKSGWKSNLKKFLSYSIIFFILILFISLPFLILKFQSYIMGYVNNISFSIEYLMKPIISYNYPVTFNSFFYLIGAPNNILFIIAFMLDYYILLGGCLGIIYLLYVKTSSYKNVTKTYPNHSLIEKAVFFSITLIISFQLFYPRGGFKYYLVLLTPFMSILFDYKNLSLNRVRLIEKKDFKFHLRYLFPLVISWIVFFCYRYIYQWILIALCLFYLYHYHKFYKNDNKELKKMTPSKEKETQNDELPRPGSVMYDFHFQAEDIKKKKLKKWQKLNKYLMIPLYRARILPLLGFGKYILILKTIGWKSQKIRRTPVEYRKMDGFITIFSAMGEKSAWVQNLRANPDSVLVQKGFHKFKPDLEFITDLNQKIEIMKSYVIKYGKSAKMLFGWNPKEDNLETIDFIPLTNLLSIIKLYEKNLGKF